MKGGSLYIYLSNGPFCMKCHLLIKILLTLGTDGLYCVAKGINPLCTLSGFCSNATCDQASLYFRSGKVPSRREKNRDAWSQVSSNTDLLFVNFFCKDFIYQIVWIASETQIWLEVYNKKIDLKLPMFSSNFLSEKPEGFAFYKSFFHAWSMTLSAVRVLKLFWKSV